MNAVSCAQGAFLLSPVTEQRAPIPFSLPGSSYSEHMSTLPYELLCNPHHILCSNNCHQNPFIAENTVAQKLGYLSMLVTEWENKEPKP